VEFRDAKAERAVGLTPADRKWMDEIVRDVNEELIEEGGTGMLYVLRLSGQGVRCSSHQQEVQGQ